MKIYLYVIKPLYIGVKCSFSLPCSTGQSTLCLALYESDCKPINVDSIQQHLIFYISQIVIGKFQHFVTKWLT